MIRKGECMMKINLSRAVRPAAVFLAAVFAFTAIPAYAATQDDVEEARDRADVIEEEKERTDQKIQELESVRGDALEYVTQLDQQLNQLQSEMDQIEAEKQQKEQEITETEAKLSEAEETEKKQYEDMKLRIRYMYEKGDSTFLDMLLTSGSVSEMLNRVEYISQITDYDRQKLDEYQKTKEEIAEDKAILEQDRQNLENMRAETEAKQQSVQTLVDAKNQEITQLAEEINNQQGQSDAYAKQLQDEQAAIAAMEGEIRAAELEAERREAEAKAAAEKAAAEKAAAETEKAVEPTAAASEDESGDEAPSAAGTEAQEEEETEADEDSQTTVRVATGTGSLEWPCPSSSNITSGYGARSAPTEGASTYHKGIDIGASTGSSIVAADSGTVAIAGYSASAGNYVMITHGDGLSTMYMHCSKLLVSEGDTVSKGETIAEVGSTGISTGSHLHFAVRKDGSYVNPLNYVSP